MIPRTALMVLALVVPIFAADEKPNVLKLPNGGQLTAPEGFGWQKVGEQEDKGKKIVMFVANKEGSTNIIFVAVMPQKTDADAERMAQIKGFHNGIVKSLSKAPKAQVKSNLTDLKPPIAQRVQFMVSSKTEDRSLHICGIVFFGRSTYHMQASGGTEEEALELAKATESLKE
jgi:hypothetical protein